MKEKRSETFASEVELKYQVYNALFLTLPFSDVSNTGAQLSLFTLRCQEELKKGKYPKEIVESFFPLKSAEALFQIMQFVERQVVLFDALEDASFNELNDLNGLGTLAGFDWEKLPNQPLEDYKVRVVLTAHPTQFYPDTILFITRSLVEAVKKNDLGRIRQILLQLGKTRFRNTRKPTPLDEAQSYIWYLENVFYPVLPSLESELKNLKNKTSPSFEIGFWPGGDRDGNPYVTAETTLAVASLLKRSILSCYQQSLEKLMRLLTFAGVHEKLHSIQVRLNSNSYLSAQELESDLAATRLLLITEHGGLFLAELDDLLAAIRTFGFHFASLDLRQDSRVIEEAILELKDNSQTISPLSADLRDCLQAVSQIQAENGIAALQRFIVSNTRNANDILGVFQLAQSLSPEQSIKLDFVPLFETITDLERSTEVMQTLYLDPHYKKHLAERLQEQTIMVGFSDGTKDGGYITANWAIYKAKTRLSEQAKAHGITLIFFDGRGGPPSRGGGNTHLFYSSLGKSISLKEIHLTIQGQTISSTYGSPSSASYNLEQLYTAGLEARSQGKDLSHRETEILDLLSQKALSSYLALKDHPLFLSYLELVTPLRFYNKLTIASRPNKRGTDKELAFSDLRAIPFVGAWTQMKQNIPGFYGLGSALAELKEAGLWSELKSMYAECRFFRALIGNAMQSLLKANFGLTAYLSVDPVFASFWHLLASEAELSEKLLREISGEESLMASNPVGAKSIAMRENIVLPLLVIQHYALQELRVNGANLSPERRDTLEKLVLKSLAASVNASRNSV